MQTIANKQTRRVTRDSGSRYQVLGVVGRDILSAEDTAGEFYLAEQTVRPGGGPPKHVHSREDELFYVIEGTLDVVLGDHTCSAGAGSLAYLPRGITHAFGNSSSSPARFLILVTPPGFAGFFSEASRRERQDDLRPADVISLGARYGLDFSPEETARRIGPNAVGQFGLVAGPGGGRTVPYMGGSATVKLSSGDTGGTLGSFEVALPPGGGPPLHVHRTFDETFYIIEGEFVFRADETDYLALPGTIIYVPQGVAHQFMNIGEREGRLANFVTPGGFEGWFPRISALESSGMLSLATISDVAADFDTTAIMEEPQLSQLTAQEIAQLRRQF